MFGFGNILPIFWKYIWCLHSEFAFIQNLPFFWRNTDTGVIFDLVRESSQERHNYANQVTAHLSWCASFHISSPRPRWPVTSTGQLPQHMWLHRADKWTELQSPFSTQWEKGSPGCLNCRPQPKWHLPHESAALTWVHSVWVGKCRANRSACTFYLGNPRTNSNWTAQR